MKHLKLFEDYQDIHDICKKYNISNYNINDDGSIDVNGSVYLVLEKMTKLPLKFRKVTGSFDIMGNNIENLEDCPRYVGGNFNCSGNKLTSLKGCPQSIVGYFNCSNNLLESLEGSPQSIGRDFNCAYNILTSLKGSPQSIGRNFFCGFNRLISLEGAPKSIGGIFYCNSNDLNSLNGCSTDIDDIVCNQNPIYYWWNKVNRKYLEIFIDMNIHSDDPDEINQEKIDIILGK